MGLESGAVRGVAGSWVTRTLVPAGLCQVLQPQEERRGALSFPGFLPPLRKKLLWSCTGPSAARPRTSHWKLWWEYVLAPTPLKKKKKKAAELEVGPACLYLSKQASPQMHPRKRPLSEVA